MPRRPSSAKQASPVLHVLAIYPFNLLLAGRLFANGATWMQRTAIGWLAFDLTRSPEFLGLIVFLSFAPAMALALVGGALSDRGAPVVILRRTRVAIAMLQAALAVLTLAGQIGPAGLAVAALTLSGVEGLQGGANKALIWHMVPRALVPVAIPLNSAFINLAAIIGPATAGVLIAASGAGGAFFACATASVLFLAVLQAVPADLGRADTDGQRGNLLADLVPLLGALRAKRAVAVVLAVQFLTSFALKPLIQLLPGLNAALGGTPQILGYLTGAYGAGAFVASFTFAAFGHARAGEWRTLFLAVAAGGATFGAAGAAGGVAAAIACLALSGMAAIIRVASLQTILQLRIDPPFRGRIMSMYIALGDAGVATGALVFGILAGATGFPAIYITVGILTALVGLLALALSNAR